MHIRDAISPRAFPLCSRLLFNPENEARQLAHQSLACHRVLPHLTGLRLAALIRRIPASTDDDNSLVTIFPRTRLYTAFPFSNRRLGVFAVISYSLMSKWLAGCLK